MSEHSPPGISQLTIKMIETQSDHNELKLKAEDKTNKEQVILTPSKAKQGKGNQDIIQHLVKPSEFVYPDANSMNEEGNQVNIHHAKNSPLNTTTEGELTHTLKLENLKKIHEQFTINHQKRLQYARNNNNTL